MKYLYEDIPLGELDCVLDDNAFGNQFRPVFTFPEFSREIRSLRFIEIAEYNIRIYECNHEKYNPIKNDYIFKYRYYLVANINNQSFCYTEEDLSFMLCVYNYLCFTKQTENLNRLDDVLCNLAIE